MTRAQKIIVMIGLIMSITYVLLPYSGQAELVLYIGVVALSFGASIAGLRSVWAGRRLPWLLTTIALGGFLAGELCWWWYQAQGIDPFPSLGDAFFLMAYVPLALGAAALASTGAARRDRTVWLDTGILTLVLGLVIWVVQIQPYATDDSITWIEKAVTMAYPIADIVAGAFVLRLVLTRSSRSRAATLLLSGVVLTMVADLAFGWLDLRGLWSAGHPVNLSWSMGYVLIGIAALDTTAVQPPAQDEAFDLGRGRLAAVLAAVLVPQVILLKALADIGALGVTVATVAVLVSSLAMVFVSLRLWALLDLARGLESKRGLDRLSALALSLGRRNQGLIARQLEGIEVMERDEQDPLTLERLFELDNVATRMRRNAESMLVLAGERSPHTWVGVVPLTQMLRTAASEVEGYRRVRNVSVEPCGIRGDAVADIAHLLAELLENALKASPPTAPVWLSARRHDDGCVVSVIDQGVGIDDHSLATINARLAEGSDEEDVPTSQLGLFVVGRLARRYGCRVTLRSNSTGGITAWLLLPPSMIADPTETPSTGTAASAVGLRPERARGLASTPPATPAMAPVHAAAPPRRRAAAPVAPAGTTANGLHRRRPAPTAPASSPNGTAAATDVEGDPTSLGAQLHRYQESVSQARSLEPTLASDAGTTTGPAR